MLLRSLVLMGFFLLCSCSKTPKSSVNKTKPLPVEPFLIHSPPLFTWGGELSEMMSKYDVSSYDINLKVDPQNQFLSGSTTVDLRALGESISILELALVNQFHVEKIKRGHEVLEFTHKNDRLSIQINVSAFESTKIEIYYSGKPPEAKIPPWHGGVNWSKSKNGKPWIGITCQMYGPQIWFPSKNHPSDEPEKVSITLTYPKDLVGVSTGILVKETVEGGWKTSHWATNYSTNLYSISFNIGDFTKETTVLNSLSGDVTVDFYFQSEDQDPTDERSWTQKKEDLRKNYASYFHFLESTLGAYPWGKEKAGVVHTKYVGMEHQTQISYGGTFQTTEAFDDLLFHELAHEWIGNSVSVNSWSDFWIQEAPVGFLEGLYLKENFGFDKYVDHLKSYKEILRLEGPVVYPKAASIWEVFDQRDFYFKGILVLASLYKWLGEETFKKALYEFVANPNHQNGNQVSTPQFISTFILQAPDFADEIGSFFDTFLYSNQLPTLNVQRLEKILYLKWNPSSLKMDVDIEINGERQRVNMQEGAATISINKDSVIKIDPDEIGLFEIGYESISHPR